MRWFERQRIEWINEIVRVVGHLNRKDIERKFTVTTVTASRDIRTFIALFPTAITYNKTPQAL